MDYRSCFTNGGDFIGSDLIRLSTGYDYIKGIIDCALDKFTEPKITQHNFSGIYFLSKSTENVLPIIKNDFSPQIEYREITDKNLKELTKSADRSGFFYLP